MFGSKKGAPPAGSQPYPVQPQPLSAGFYPSAPPSYDQAMAQPMGPPQPIVPQQGFQYGGPPPPPQMWAPAGGPPGMYGQQFPPGPGAPGPGQAAVLLPGQTPPPGQYPPAGVPIPPGADVHIPGAFNAGARFDGHAQVRIPPPPPGCAPNMAQMAAMSGARVVTSKRSNDKWGGGAGGGAVFW